MSGKCLWDTDWTEQKIGQLRADWAEGYSTPEIGRRLGVSKNAVIGKARRIGLPARKSPILQTNDGDHVRTGRPRSHKAKPKSELPVQVAAATLAPLVALVPSLPEPPKMPDRPVASPAAILRFVSGNVASHQYPPERKCCWPLGELRTPEFRFCGDPVTRPNPYCDEHWRLARPKSAVVEADAA